MKGTHLVIDRFVNAVAPAHAEEGDVNGVGKSDVRPTGFAAILLAKPHLEQGYRACLGLMRLGKRYGAARREAAAARRRPKEGRPCGTPSGGLGG